jgi:hypothetical protein
LDKSDISEVDRNKAKEKNRTKPNGQKDRYRARKDTMEIEDNKKNYLTRLRPKTMPTIPENSVQKHRDGKFQIEYNQLKDNKFQVLSFFQ